MFARVSLSQCGWINSMLSLLSISEASLLSQIMVVSHGRLVSQCTVCMISVYNKCLHHCNVTHQPCVSEQRTSCNSSTRFAFIPKESVSRMRAAPLRCILGACSMCLPVVSESNEVDIALLWKGLAFTATLDETLCVFDEKSSHNIPVSEELPALFETIHLITCVLSPTL
jgi:hypothetical protein